MTDPLARIYNYRWLGEALATAGQPTATELAAVARAGFEVVINLGLSDQPYSLANERELVEALGLDYVHIPVQWEHPTARDIDRFIEAVRAREGQRLFVHCAANKRVSAFMALYRMTVLGWSRQEAMRDLRESWEPNAIWREFIDAQLLRLGRVS